MILDIRICNFDFCAELVGALLQAPLGELTTLPRPLIRLDIRGGGIS